MENCLGVVLAGGLSSRMGTDKALLTREDQKMLEFSENILRQAGLSNIVVSGTRNDVANSISDIYQQAGPLGGIYSVLKSKSCQAILALPVDLPLIDAQTIKTLITNGQLSGQACFYEGHALPIYLPNNAYTELFFESAFNNFNGKGPSVRAMLKQVPHQVLPQPSAQQLINTNTPQEWQQAKQLLKQHRKTYGSR